MPLLKISFTASSFTRDFFCCRHVCLFPVSVCFIVMTMSNVIIKTWPCSSLFSTISGLYFTPNPERKRDSKWSSLMSQTDKWTNLMTTVTPYYMILWFYRANKSLENFSSTLEKELWIICVSVHYRLSNSHTVAQHKATHNSPVSPSVHKPNEFRVRYTWRSNCDAAVIKVAVVPRRRMPAMSRGSFWAGPSGGLQRGSALRGWICALPENVSVNISVRVRMTIVTTISVCWGRQYRAG